MHSFQAPIYLSFIDQMISDLLNKFCGSSYIVHWQSGVDWMAGVENFQDFLIKLDIKPLMHLLKISIFSLNKDIVRLTKIMNNLVKDCKIRTFKVIFLCLKLVESFQKTFSVKNVWLGDQLLLMKFFENFYFLST